MQTSLSALRITRLPALYSIDIGPQGAARRDRRRASPVHPFDDNLQRAFAMRNEVFGITVFSTRRQLA
jgi:hypothetical protein